MLIIGCILEGYRSLKDKTLKITFETSEPTPEQLVAIATLIGKFGFLAFKEDAFKTQEKDVLENLESDYEDKSKTPSQRLRNVFYVKWQQDPQGYKDFNLYYDYYMNKVIEFYKGTLE